MPHSFDEGRLRFTFAEEWRVLKWDEHPAYEEGLRRVTDTKAVDFIATRGSLVWFLEVKDFRGHAAENKERLGRSLADEVADKVRDTLASLTWACGREEVDIREDVRPLLRAILRRDPGVRVPVVLWLEPGRKLDALQRITIADQIKRRLAWAGVRPLVLEGRIFDPETIPGLTVGPVPR
jgi:hypothetical protein